MPYTIGHFRIDCVLNLDVHVQEFLCCVKMSTNNKDSLQECGKNLFMVAYLCFRTISYFLLMFRIPVHIIYYCLNKVMLLFKLQAHVRSNTIERQFVKRLIVNGVL